MKLERSLIEFTQYESTKFCKTKMKVKKERLLLELLNYTCYYKLTY